MFSVWRNSARIKKEFDWLSAVCAHSLLAKTGTATRQSEIDTNNTQHTHKIDTMSTEDAEAPAANDLKSGPFSVLYNAVRGNTQVLVNVRNNHKLLGRVKAYDRHMNLYVRGHFNIILLVVIGYCCTVSCEQSTSLFHFKKITSGCWKMSRKCGRKRAREERARHGAWQLIKIGMSVKCFSGEIPSFWS